MIRLYVANLGKYNEGELVGEWFDLPVDMDEVKATIGINEQYEEWAIHDYEAPFQIGEYDSIDRLNEIAEMLDNVDHHDEFAVTAILGAYATEEALSILENQEYRVYHNCKSMGDVAYEIYEETGLLEQIERVMNSGYVDWDAIGRDMEIEGNFEYVGNETYIEIYNV